MNAKAKDILYNVWGLGRTLTPEEAKFLEEFIPPGNGWSNLDACLYLCGLYDKYISDGMPEKQRIEFVRYGTFSEFKNWIYKNAR